MRRAPNLDRNHHEIVDAFRAGGALVHSTAQLGGGFPDLVVWHRGRYLLVEIKDGDAPPSKQRLTEAEELFHHLWPVSVVRSLEDVKALLLKGRRP